MEASELLAFGKHTGISQQLVFRAEPYVFVDAESGEFALSAASVFEVPSSSSAGHHNVVVACRMNGRTPDYFAWCGDAWFEGGPRVGTRVQDAIKAGVAIPTGVIASLEAMYGDLQKSAGCHFWSQYKKGKVCKHVAQVLSDERALDLDGLATAAAQMNGIAPARALGASGEAAFLQRYAFRKPLLLEGDAGSLKTWSAVQFAKTNGLPLVMCQGSAAKGDALALLGFWVKNADGGLTWMDGEIAQAFRLAQAQRVVLVIDELLRIPDRALSILISALSLDDEGCYSLRTMRLVNETGGVGETEVLRVPQGNLAIIATTNVGTAYQVDDMDIALRDRFMPMRSVLTEDKLRGALDGVASTRGFAPDVVDRCVRFWKGMTSLQRNGQVNHAPNARSLTDTLRLAVDADDVPEVLRHHALVWADREATGAPVPEQIELIEECIRKVFC